MTLIDDSMATGLDQSDSPDGTRTVMRTCPLCEATCGLEITMRGDDVMRIRGDRLDVFSKGFICPKGSTIKQLDADPDRIRVPMIRDGQGWREVSWRQAFDEIDRRLRLVHDAHGRDAVGVYVGNPNAHNLDALLYNGAFLKALRTKNVFSASTVDQMPKQVSAGLMFGTVLSIPVADIDRTDHLMLFGANPYESNGSLMTAPDFPGRLEALRARGGRVVVVDPRRTKTADHADEHVPIRPGTDAWLLLAMAAVLVEDGLVDLGRVAPWVNGMDELRTLLAAVDIDTASRWCAVPTATITRLAHELAAAPRAAVYGRIGTCLQEHGTVASWLVDVLNILTGNLDQPGGAMFTSPATGSANMRGKGGKGRGVKFGRWTSRVKGHPEVYGEFPVVTLAEEITTPGDGQIRALFTVAGNPVLSTPGGPKLADALDTLELMVSVDIYLNETSRHAHVLLPGSRVLSRSHYDVALYQLAVRNVANWSAPVVELAEDELAEWEILLRLTAIARGMGADVDLVALDTVELRAQVDVSVGADGSLVQGRDGDELMAMLGDAPGPDRRLDLSLRTGPYGDGFGTRPDGLSLAVLAAHPHGIDLGPLQPRIPDVLRTPSAMIELAPLSLVAHATEMLSRRVPDITPMVLVGRRDLRSNNSWMHNVEVLVKGRPRCTLHVHPDDARDLGACNGQQIRVRTTDGSVVAPMEVSDTVMRGVVSLPHGWGHVLQGTRQNVAKRYAGVNTNVLFGTDLVDPLSGNAVLNGITVELELVTNPTT